MKLNMKLKDKIKSQLREETLSSDSKNEKATIVVKDADEAKKVNDKVNKATSNTTDKDKVDIVVTDESYSKELKEEETDEAYNIYAVCTDSISKTAGTSERSKWSDSETDRYEKCVKNLKGKKGYKLGESVKPKMTKDKLIETILNTNTKKVVKKFKVKDILK